MKDRYGLAGRIVSDKYQIEALVGVGGMSAVYTALQIGVGRRVAFKILLPHLANNAQHVANLFEREAKTAGQLSHENIATIYDAGYTIDEIAYIAMEWVDGQTLEDEIAQSGHLTLERSAAILRQICAALDLAHSKLIIHRDLKPSNIMLSRRQDGQEQVKVLDFGLAKLANEAKDVLVSTAVGTPHYASPEQFQTGAEIDARTDIYALGVTLYQMLTGRLPFNSGSVHEVIRQHMLEVPPPIRELRPDVPPAVDELVQRMMAKNPHYRPQKAGEVIFLFERALALMADEVATPQYEPEVIPAVHAVGATNHLNGQFNGQPSVAHTGFAQPTSNPFQSRSQRNGATASNPFQVRTLREEMQARTAMLEETPKYPSLSDLTTSALKPPGGRRLQWFKQHKIVGGLVLLALVLGATFGVFFAAKPYLNEKDTVLVADFVNKTGDEVFDVALKHALSVQLAQSPFLNLFMEEKVKETLRFMGRKPDERLTPEVAREIGQRQGLKAIIVGRIDRIGNNYSISLQAINSVTGDTFGDTFSEANGKERVLQALGQTATEFRKKLGESLSSIEKFNKPIQDATTSSLDALKAYSLGREQSMRKGNPTEALTLYKRAVELDPNFALAYVGLATLYANRGEAELATENAEKAFHLIDRISEPERFSAWFTYHFLVKADVEKAIETLKTARQTYPHNPNTVNNMAVCYGSIGQFEAALNSTQETLGLDPRNISAQVNSAELQLRFSRFKEAKDAINNLLAQKIERSWMHSALYQIGFMQNDPALMQQQLDWALNRQDEVLALTWQAQTAALKGRLREATQHYQRAIELAKQRQLPEQAAALSISLALRQATYGSERDAQQALNEALILSRNNFVKYPPGNAVPFGAFTLALAGDAAQAIHLCEETVQQSPRNTFANHLWVPATNAAIQLNQGQPAKAVELLRVAAPYDPVASFAPLWLRGQAYLQLNKGREAAGEFQRILANRGWDPTSTFYPLAQLGLARAYALLGDSGESRKHYTEFFQTWKDADADLPVLLAAKKEFAALR